MVMHFDVCGFEHLHLHSHFSLLDGFGKPEEYSERAKQINQQFLCITDHGVMGVIPSQIRACKEHGIHPIFGVELYVNDYQPAIDTPDKYTSYVKALPEEDRQRLKKSYHLLAIAYNSQGYSNLVQLSSWGHTFGFGGVPRRPRVTHEQLLKHKEGIIFTSCCFLGEIGQAFDVHGPDAAMDKIVQYRQMFGDSFFLELMLLDFKKQKPYDKFLVKAHDKLHIPLILTQDCHYCYKEDSKFQQYMLMTRTKNTVQDIKEAMAKNEDMDRFFELQDQNLWMKSEDELNEKWLSDYKDIIPYELFCEAKRNTVAICQKTKGVEIDREIKLPSIPHANEKLKEAIALGFKWRGLSGKEYFARSRKEYELIVRKDFASYFLITKMMTDEARRVCPKILGWGTGEEALGPGRGCLAPDSKIVMADGKTKRIDEIVIGDDVVTIDGSARKVVKTMRYHISEPCLNIKCYYGEAAGITLTSDHEILAEKGIRPEGWNTWSDARRKKSRAHMKPTGDLSWIKAEDLSIGDWVFVPRPQNIKDIPSIDLAQWSNGKELTFDESNSFHNIINPLTGNANRVKVCDRYIPLNDEWLEVLGRWVGDGWIKGDGKTHIGFAFHADDNHGIEFVVGVMRAYGFDDIRIDWSKNRQVAQVIIKNRNLYTLIRELHPNYKLTADTKHIPDVVLSLPPERLWPYLRGYCLSDGHYGRHKNKITTCSRILADQTRFLCWKCSIPASLGYDHRKDYRKDFQNTKPSYYLNLPKDNHIGPEQAKKQYVYYAVDGGLLLKVRAIKEINDVHVVYDIEVEGNSNYLTSSFLVHNSAVGFLTCYLLGITDTDPVRHDLLSERFLSDARGGKQIRLRFDTLPEGLFDE